jgi:polar amino acid transport system substrate-binding protein
LKLIPIKVADMKKLVALLLAGLFIILACSAPASEVKVRVLTEDYPPCNYVDDNGQVVGQSTEVVKAIMNKLGQKINIEVLPWEQGFDLAQKEPGIALYSASRTPERENMFLWVGPIYNTQKYLYARKSSSLKINSLADVKNVKAISGVKNDSGVKFCLDAGGKLIYSATGYEALKKLMDGSADLWLGPGPDISIAAKKAGVNPGDIEPVFLVHKYDQYIAFNKNTPPAIVKQWQQALDSIKK